MYDATFLGPTVGVPEPVGEVADDVLDVDGTTQWDYTHFSLAMSASRRLARWVAWQIDGLTLFPGDSIPRADDFRLDPRLPAEAQTGEEVYAGNDLDRGHVARRSDLLWGTLDEAKQANSDSFHFTNITPQHEDFNQSGRGGVWGLLENAVLELDGLEDRRLTLFGGPVLGPDDPPYRGVQLPVEHWKVVVYRLGPARAARGAHRSGLRGSAGRRRARRAPARRPRPGHGRRAGGLVARCASPLPRGNNRATVG